MQRQYKLFKISKNKVDFTLKKLNEKRNFIRITESVLAVEYDYMKNGYKKLLDDMSELSAMQYIITTSIFYKILTCMVKKGVTIKEIHFNELFNDDNLLIGEWINNINNNIDKDISMHRLLDLLQWYNYDEGIDLNYMSFWIEKDQRRCSFHIYNNGIVAIDVENICDEVIDLLREIV